MLRTLHCLIDKSKYNVHCVLNLGITTHK